MSGTPWIVYFAAYASAGTAVGTVGLALATYWLGRKTRDLATDAEHELAVATEQAKATTSQAEATTQLVELTQAQMRSGQAPVVIPYAVPGSVPGRSGPQVVNPREAKWMPVPIVPRIVGGGLLVVPIMNAGVGPAFDIKAEFDFRDQRGGASLAPQPHQLREGAQTALGAGQDIELRPAFGNLASPLLPFIIKIEYTDSLGVRYATRATYFPSEEVYRDVVFVAPEGSELPH